MTAEELKTMQAPIKERYRQDASKARATLTARGVLDVSRLICHVDSWASSPTPAGIHPLAGGPEGLACAAEILLQSLVACAGVTICAVGTAMSLGVTAGELVAEGDLDFRGTLGVSREVPVGFTAIRLIARVSTPAESSQLAKLAELTERYCVVAQSLKTPLHLVVERMAPVGDA